MAGNSSAALMGEDSILSLLIKCSLPSFLASLANASYNIVDTIFVGRIGSKAIAALSIVFPLQFTFGAVAMGIGIGTASYMSRSLGANKEQEANIAGNQIFFLSLVFTAITLVFGLTYLENILLLLGATPEILGLAMEYASVILWGSGTLFLLFMIIHVIRAEGNFMTTMKIIVFSCVANIVLDPIFIFYFNMGVRGAAIATVLARVLAIMQTAYYFKTGEIQFKINYLHMKPNLPILKEIFIVGVPSILLQTVSNISFVALNRVLAGFGYMSIAVMGLIQKLQMLIFMPCFGISQGLLPIIGYNFGAKNFLRVREALIKGIFAATGVVVPITILMYLFPEFFLRIFTKDPSVIETGRHAIRIIVLFYPFGGAHIVAIGFFQAIGKGSSSFTLVLLNKIILYIPFLLLLSRSFGLTGAWAATPLADGIAFIIIMFWVWLELKKYGLSLFKSLPVTKGV
jgi:putative MATE family efflux protein